MKFAPLFSKVCILALSLTIKMSLQRLAYTRALQREKSISPLFDWCINYPFTWSTSSPLINEHQTWQLYQVCFFSGLTHTLSHYPDTGSTSPSSTLSAWVPSTIWYDWYVVARDQTHELLFPGADMLPTKLYVPGQVSCIKCFDNDVPFTCMVFYIFKLIHSIISQ